MGKGIVYCQGCGCSLRDDDFERRRAGMHENRPYCAHCRTPEALPPPEPAPQARGRSTARILKAPPPPTARRPAPAPDSRKTLILGGGLAALAVIILLVVLSSRGGGPPPREEPDPVARAADAALEAEVASLERFSNSSKDPEAILARCEQARAKFKGTPQAERLREIEARARELRRLLDEQRKADEALARVRQLRKEDPGFEKHEEVLALLKQASAAGVDQRRAAQKIREEYEADFERWKKEAEGLPPPGHRASHCNAGDTVAALSDGRLPQGSGDGSIPRMTFWNHRGTVEWITFDFGKIREVGAVSVYWFDDTNVKGHCRPPDSWKLFAWEGGDWKEVRGASGYGNAVNSFNRTTFTPLRTGALKIEVKLQKDWSGGLLEWQVEP